MRGSRTRLLVNDRADIAQAARADGVHLTTRSVPARVVRRAFGADFLIGVSCHTLEEVRAAEREGANYVLFGPVFAPRSKSQNSAGVRSSTRPQPARCAMAKTPRPVTR